MVACGYSSRLVTAACLSAGMGGLTRQARPIVTHQWNLITTPRVDACGCDRFAGFGKVVQSGGMGGGWGGGGRSRTGCGGWRGEQGWVVGGGGGGGEVRVGPWEMGWWVVGRDGGRGSGLVGRGGG